ncbi:hypothetical protein BT63DRAFT_457281 [Microthyrium microscopicum]|uniref:Uncharacterized protein n=1 Tax=Microthyrium microscopicum TaxID=703497 RepID=A0A6A6UA24_9PEZI|nr:hypothetical protein BT63DRAFT_457281 [Microthyrium microscopicum]
MEDLPQPQHDRNSRSSRRSRSPDTQSNAVSYRSRSNEPSLSSHDGARDLNAPSHRSNISPPSSSSANSLMNLDVYYERLNRSMDNYDYAVIYNLNEAALLKSTCPADLSGYPYSCHFYSRKCDYVFHLCPEFVGGLCENTSLWHWQSYNDNERPEYYRALHMHETCKFIRPIAENMLVHKLDSIADSSFTCNQYHYNDVERLNSHRHMSIRLKKLVVARLNDEEHSEKALFFRHNQHLHEDRRDVPSRNPFSNDSSSNDPSTNDPSSNGSTLDGPSSASDKSSDESNATEVPAFETRRAGAEGSDMVDT